MRKQIAGRKLGRTTSQRKQLWRGLVADLILRERVITTVPKAKEAQKKAEKLVTKAQKKSLSAQRQVFSMLNNDNAAQHLIESIAPLFTGRPGGYTRILKMGSRIGDNAQQAVLEWVVKPPKKEVKKSAQTSKNTKKKEKSRPKTDQPRAEKKETKKK